MFYLECYDQYGNPITRMTQWDLNQKLYITEHNFTTAPLFHFCNKNTEKALVVQSVLSDNLLTVDVPNQLLIEPYPITVYVYLPENNGGKTVEIVNIPITARPKPNDFEYKDNIEIISLTDLANEIRNLNDSISTAELQRITAETLRISNENERIENESVRDTAEQTRIENERIRNENENIRIASENERESAEGDRVIAENDRVTEENVRKQSEVERNESESQRKLNEDTREDNESKRIKNEEQRQLSEVNRENDELERIENEELRKTNELNRDNAESIRKSNEETRQEQESVRQTNTSTAIKNAEKATDRANLAAQGCENIIAGTGFIPIAEKGIANGIATLDENGKIYQSQIPSIDSDMLNGQPSEFYAKQEDIDNIINGVDVVGNALNLDGHDSSYYATADELELKAPLNNPELIGIPTAPTASTGTNTTQIATTAFVQEALGEAILIFTDISVPVSSWKSDTTYETYPYKADIDCEGVTADYKPDVTYDVQEATSGVYAPVAQTGAGVVSIYASEIPVDVITIPIIMCVKAVSV